MKEYKEWILLVLFIIILFFGIRACNNNQKIIDKKKRILRAEINDLPKTLAHKKPDNRAITIGNNTFINIDIPGEPSECARKIISIIEGFEKGNPYKRILHWHIEKQQNAHSSTNPHIFGIWIQHEPKEPK